MPTEQDDDLQALEQSTFEGHQSPQFHNETYAKELDAIKSEDSLQGRLNRELDDDAQNAYREVTERAAHREQTREQFGKYHERAKKEGTSIGKALDHYVRMDDTLRQDIGTGLAIIAQNSGLDQRGAVELFNSLAQRYSGGGQGQQPQHQQADPAQYETQVQAACEAATRDIPDFRALENEMVAAITSGAVPRTGNPQQDVLAAYKHAKEAARAKEDAAVAKAKAASRGVGGSGSGNLTQFGVRPHSPDDEIEADVRSAYYGVRG